MSHTYQALIFDLYGVIYTGRSGAPVDTDLVAYIEQCARDYAIALCSNISTAGLAQILREHELTKLFDVVVTSEMAGAPKPSPKIFNYTLTQLQVAPEDALFIDDQASNVAGAEAAGLFAVQYTDLPTLQRHISHAAQPPEHKA